MPISDAYIVQYLLDGTAEFPAPIRWREKDTNALGFLTRIEDVDVTLEPSYSRTGSHMVLRFQHDGEEFLICEPVRRGWLGRRFLTHDEREMNVLFRELVAAVSAQCAERRQRAEHNHQQIRERIGRQLLFGRVSSR